MATGRILVVDDEPGMLRLLSLYLGQAGFAVYTAATGGHAVETIEQAGIDLVVLDIGLPDMDGYSVCRRIRATHDVPVIMLTARSDPEDRLRGFELGADDYLPKPFMPEELVARVQAVFRRLRPSPNQGRQIALDGLVVGLLDRTVRVGDREVELRPKEFDLLVKLASHPDHVFTRDQLLTQVWGYDSLGDTATVDVHIGRLRRKLGDSGVRHRWIRTVWGVGYRFNPSSHGA